MATNQTRLHLGSGGRRPPGFYNIDSRADTNPDLVGDICDLNRYDANTVDEVYACHVLEHLGDPIAAMREWHRVLIYHGILRLAVPDIGSIARALVSGVHLRRLEGLIWGRHDYPENVHHHGWDFETLAEDLRVCGFYDARLWDPEAVFGFDYHDFSYGRLHLKDGGVLTMSLNVMARKI